MPRPPQTFAGKVWVTGVTLLIAFIAYTSQIFIIWPWYGREVTVELLVLIGPFNLMVAFLYWNYFLCVYTDPGTPPADWVPEAQSSGGFEVKSLTGQPRWCRHCEKYKPPRTHHCKTCKRCVLRMDHHCPWTDNCIGHYNYAHFIRFLWAVDIACSYHLAMLTRRVYYALLFKYWEPGGVELAFLVANYAACIPVIVAVGLFSIYHFYCMLTNTTTVEGWEKDKVTTLVRRGKISQVQFPYNLGPRRNFLAAFGSNPLFWCWPLKSVESDGLSFPVADGSEPSEQYSWPPKDPFRDIDAPRKEMPSSPWTYGNEGFNPSLQPSNRRQAAAPPYHPSYDKEEEDDRYSTSSSPERESHSSNEYIPYPQQDGTRRRDGWMDASDEDVPIKSGMRVRRGSEGWETTMPNRWAQVEEQILNDEESVSDTPLDEESARGRPAHRR